MFKTIVTINNRLRVMEIHSRKYNKNEMETYNFGTKPSSGYIKHIKIKKLITNKLEFINN